MGYSMAHCNRPLSAIYITILLLCCGSCCEALDVKDWLNWITGKSEIPTRPDTPAQTEALSCTTRGGTKLCILEVTPTSPDAFALHQLLRVQTLKGMRADPAVALHVIIRGGAYTSIPLTIPDNMHLTIEKGAALVFNSTDVDLYKLWFSESLPSYPTGSDAGGLLRYRAHLDCDGCSNVKIDGEGIIDGGGQLWWEIWTAKQAGNAGAAAFLNKDRPALLEFRGCDGVIIVGVTFQNSPYWGLHTYNCSNIHIQQVAILNPPGSPNTAGLVLDSSTNIDAQDVRITAGGDCVMIKSGVRGLPLLPSANISLGAVTCSAPSQSGLLLGPEMAGGLDQLSAVRWALNDTQHGATLETRWGQPGTVSNVMLQQWTLSPSVSDMLLIDTGRNSGLASGWGRLRTNNITLTGIRPQGTQLPLVRICGNVPFWLGGFHIDGGLRIGLSCWRPVWVGGVCEASPGFLIFLWAFAAFLLLLAALGGLGLAFWIIIARIRRCLRRRNAADGDDVLSDAEDTLDLETVELINMEARRNWQLTIQDSLQDPESYVMNGRSRSHPKMQLPLK